MIYYSLGKGGKKTKLSLAGEKEVFVYKADTFLFKLIEQLSQNILQNYVTLDEQEKNSQNH